MQWVLYYFAKRSDATSAPSGDSSSASTVRIANAKGSVLISGSTITRITPEEAAASKQIGAPKPHQQNCFKVQQGKERASTSDAEEKGTKKDKKNDSKKKGKEKEARAYYFCAETTEEYEQWTEVLQQAAGD